MNNEKKLSECDNQFFVRKIQNYNCEGLCIETMCNNKYTHSVVKVINGMKCILSFCELHAKMYEDD